jgi:hypothetical protein
VGLPLACWTSYEAWGAFQKIDFWDEQIEYWKTSAAEQDRTGISTGISPHAQLMGAYQHRNENARMANTLPLIAATLVALPILGLMLFKVFEWVWSGPASTSTKQVGSQPLLSTSWKSLFSSKRVRWAMGVAGVLVFTGIMYALRPESTTSTLIQVLVQVAVLGGVLALIKFIRKWVNHRDG